MFELGINILFSKCSICWDNAEVPMQQPEWLNKEHVDEFENKLFMMHDPASTDDEKIQKILDMTCTQADLPEVVKKWMTQKQIKKKQLLKVLQKFEECFDGTLGCWNCRTIELELKDLS